MNESEVLKPAQTEEDTNQLLNGSTTISSTTAIHPQLPGEEEIGRMACWSVSSAKPGFGVENLRDGNLKTYWQSDGMTPHTITIHFRRMTIVTSIRFYVDGAEDDSYCPDFVEAYSGSTPSDMQLACSKRLNTPTGWIIMRLSDGPRIPQLASHTFKLVIRENHNGGKDTHIRQVLVFSCKQTMELRDDLIAFTSSVRLIQHTSLR